MKIYLSSESYNRDIVIKIVDGGCGISPEHLGKIFERSFTFGKPRGTGLGLAYCKQVVEAHGGTIEVESEIGKGTTFIIRIPNCVVPAPAVSEVSEQVAPLTSTLALTPTSPSNLRFFIADDDPDIRAQWKRIIGERGRQLVYSATSLEDILAKNDIDFKSVDTAIVDYQYEGSAANGLDVIAYLKMKGVRRVHLCTGFHDDPELGNKAAAAGAESVIGKPIADNEIDFIFG